MNRRSLLKIGAALGIGGQSITKAAAQSMAIGATPRAMGSVGTLPDAPAPPWTNTPLTKAAWRALNKRHQEAQDRWHRRMSGRVVGLDPDLYERRSGAGWWRAAVQTRRDREISKRMDEMRVQLWPTSDDGW